MQISSVSASSYMQQMQQAMFQKADSNADGALSLSEFTAAAPAKSTGPASASDQTRAANLFKSMDTDGNGQVSQNEMAAFMSNLTSDTQSSLISLQQQPSGPQDPIAALMTQADSNGDGSLSLDEFTAAAPKGASADQSAALFKQMDTNGDGQVSQTELKTAAAGHHHHHGGGHGPKASATSDDSANPSLADILAGTASSSTTDTTTLAGYLSQASGTADASGSSATDLSKQLSAYVTQMLSGYADQTKSSTSGLGISV